MRTKIEVDSSKLTRRSFFSRFSDGVHGAALSCLLAGDLLPGASCLYASGAESSPPNDLKPRKPHFAPKAKSVIHLFMNGGPSHVDLLDPKPMLTKFAGSAPGRDILTEIEFANEVGTMLPSPFKFARRGKCGMELSELLPHLGEHADDITLIRALYGESFNHEPSLYLMHSGRTI